MFKHTSKTHAIKFCDIKSNTCNNVSLQKLIIFEKKHASANNIHK